MTSAKVSYFESETAEGLKIGGRRGARSNSRRSFDENGFTSNFVKIWGFPCPLVSPALLSPYQSSLFNYFKFYCPKLISKDNSSMFDKSLADKVYRIWIGNNCKNFNLERKIGLTFKIFGIATMSFCFSRLKAWRVAPPMQCMYADLM